MNIHWPARPDWNADAAQPDDWVPWYQIIRRVVCMPFFYGLRALTWVFVLLGWGHNEAKYWWEQSA